LEIGGRRGVEDQSEGVYTIIPKKYYAGHSAKPKGTNRYGREEKSIIEQNKTMTIQHNYKTRHKVVALCRNNSYNFMR
jgi:hypothetical protein